MAGEPSESTLPFGGFAVTLTVAIRAARHRDLRDLEWFGLFAGFRAEFEATFRRQESGKVVLLVAEANGFPVGQVLVDPTARRAEGVGVLSALRVLPCLQRLGIGSRLLAAAERELRARGLAQSEVGACKDNAGARRLYERAGYRVVGTNREPYAYPRPDGTVQDGTFEEWILRKPLADV